ncbi:hypothetical protein [Rubrivirga sp.]
MFALTGIAWTDVGFKSRPSSDATDAPRGDALEGARSALDS